MTPNDGGGTNLMVGGDLASCGFRVVQMPVKTDFGHGRQWRRICVITMVKATLTRHEMMAVRDVVLPPKDIIFWSNYWLEGCCGGAPSFLPSQRR